MCILNKLRSQFEKRTSLVAYSINQNGFAKRLFCFFFFTNRFPSRTMIIGICLLMSKEAITTNVLFFFLEEKEPVCYHAS